ncbi:MAG: hypothetical protein M3N45_11230, partial [Actinomycetota bacterium]|nr:hypothetical protein [Actinomycetota bacterium]
PAPLLHAAGFALLVVAEQQVNAHEGYCRALRGAGRRQIERGRGDERETGAGLKAKPSLLYGRYKLWCEETGEQVMRSQDFSQSLQDRGFARGKSDGGRVYKGITLARSAQQGQMGTDQPYKHQEISHDENKPDRVPPSVPDGLPETVQRLYDTDPDYYAALPDSGLRAEMVECGLIDPGTPVTAVARARIMEPAA